jgi:tRNA modification GTPase
MSLSATHGTIHPDDTIVALSSAGGVGSRAIVRVSGPQTTTAIHAVFTPHDSRGFSDQSRRLIPGSVRLTELTSPLPAILYFFKGPKSYTGQDLAELHTSNSAPLLERLIADLLNSGARSARPGEFTMRAFLAGKKDLAQAEAVQAVIEAGTDADLQGALVQLAGGMTQPLHGLRDDLLNLLADLEAALDFADEDIEFVGQVETLDRLNAALRQLTELQRQLDDRTLSGRPVRVALVGLPNVGKSSLFNALAESDAIVSALPGTTRDYLMKAMDLKGMQIELIDTAGWEEAEDAIEQQAQALGSEQAGHADVILWCVESGAAFDNVIENMLAQTGARVIPVLTKCDRDSNLSKNAIGVSVVVPGGTEALRSVVASAVASLNRSPLAPSPSRCRHHLAAGLAELARARDHLLHNDPPELNAASLRMAIDHLGALTGAVYTNDLLDRIFSRFCIGK